MEEIVLVIMTLVIVYVCFWSVRNDEIYNARKTKERFRIPGAPEEPEPK